MSGEEWLDQEKYCWVKRTAAGSREDLLGQEKIGWVKRRLAR